MRRRLAIVGFFALSACGGGATRPPPPSLAFDGLPIAGTLAQARAAGFTRCYADTTFMRCRRDGIQFQGFGPYSGAVDLNGNDGAGGFDHLTMWSDLDQSALLEVSNRLRAEGWTACYSGRGSVGKEALFTRPGATVQVVVDMSYWGKRRLRVYPARSPHAPRCGAPPSET